jgi:hypothetical protein
MIPLHARTNEVPPEYFWPPSCPERPVDDVKAYFQNLWYLFHRDHKGAPWKLMKIEPFGLAD